jgi:glutathione-independent formaldehyde dehydrogenase
VDLTLPKSLPEQLNEILGVPEVDCAIDCVG